MTMTLSGLEVPSHVDVSAFMAPPPVRHHEPLKIADDTYVIRQIFGEGQAPQVAYVNSMVITGKEPVIVDTMTANNREAWLNDVFSLVDPKDVRWIFISHDDHDHTGNLAEALALCTNATLISTWFQVERLAGDYLLPPHRMRWIEDGGTFDAGDRVFSLVRPPVFDSPTTRGIFDPKTGVYWASDAFSALVTEPMDDTSGFHPEEWRQAFAAVNLAISPWIHMVDAVKYNKSVERIAKLDPKVIASAHTPPILGADVGTAIDMAYDLPFQPAPQLPGQETLDAIIAQLSGQQPV